MPGSPRIRDPGPRGNSGWSARSGLHPPPGPHRRDGLHSHLGRRLVPVPTESSGAIPPAALTCGAPGSGRPPGYCRERNANSIARSRLASASSARRSSRSGGIHRDRVDQRASMLWRSLPAPSPTRAPPGRAPRSRLHCGTSPDPAARPANRRRTRQRPRTPGPWALVRASGQFSIVAWRSPSDSSFVPRSSELLWVQLRIAGCAFSGEYEVATAVFWPSVSASWVR